MNISLLQITDQMVKPEILEKDMLLKQMNECVSSSRNR